MPACKSMGHTLPDGQYRLQLDDLMNRVVYGQVAWQTLPTSGMLLAQMKTYWRREWAIQQDERLASIPIPKGVLGGVELPLVEEVATPVETTPSPSLLSLHQLPRLPRLVRHLPPQQQRKLRLFLKTTTCPASRTRSWPRQWPTRRNFAPRRDYPQKRGSSSPAEAGASLH